MSLDYNFLFKIKVVVFMNAFKNLKKSKYLLHETKKSVLFRFLLIVGIVVSYFAFISFRYGVNQGFGITILTWTFFIFCTPIADAGFLIDFPFRLITGFRMIYSETTVWITGFLINLFVFTHYPQLYGKTIILKLFYQIITHPFPYWGIIFISALGTFISVYFGDELVDVAKHRERKKFQKHYKKYKFVIFVFLVILVVVLYDFMLNNLGISVPLL